MACVGSDSEDDGDEELEGRSLAAQMASARNAAE